MYVCAPGENSSWTRSDTRRGREWKYGLGGHYHDACLQLVPYRGKQLVQPHRFGEGRTEGKKKLASTLAILIVVSLPTTFPPPIVSPLFLVALLLWFSDDLFRLSFISGLMKDTYRRWNKLRKWVSTQQHKAFPTTQSTHMTSFGTGVMPAPIQISARTLRHELSIIMMAGARCLRL